MSRQTRLVTVAAVVACAAVAAWTVAIDFSYRLPYTFTGTIDKVTFVLK